MLVIDEAHHATARSYRKIIEKAKTANPDLKLLGVTATPLRGDKKSLRAVFTNCGAQLSLQELILEGALVKPRAFVIDVGVQDDLRDVPKVGSDYDMGEVAKIMDRTPIAEAVIREWKQKAGNRQTIVFCSTIKHAQHMTEAFQDAGIKAATVSGKTPLRERQEILTALKYHDIQVLMNVNVATEGFDEPSLSCVVLLRPSSQKNTLIQMIGRGLRPFKDERRDLIKQDCIILDFGTSLHTHGDLEQEVELNPVNLPGMGEAPLKACPTCRARIPVNTLTCPFCEYVFKGPDAKTLSDFRLREIDIINRLRYEWEDLFHQGNAYIATGLKTWCGVFLKKDMWHAIGGKSKNLTLITRGTQEQAFVSAEAWLKKQGESAVKAPNWHSKPATSRQLSALPLSLTSREELTRYQASCWLRYLWAHKKILNIIVQEAA
jgi:hypothetical protein